MIEYEGVKYDSIKQLAEAFGIKYHTFFYRYKKWGIDRAVKEEVIRGGRKSSIFPDDILELAEENNIDYKTLHSRHKRGMHMFDAAIEEKGSLKSGRKSVFTDEEKELLRKHGIKETVARYRLRQGFMSRYDALTMCHDDFWRVGDTYLTLEQVNTARKNGLDKDIVYKRAYVLGYEIDDAVSMPRQTKFANKKENVG